MKLSAFFITALLLCATSAKPQTDEKAPISIEKEPHHSVTFENNRVRVFHLQLQPNEATRIHRHPSFYAYFSLQPAKISNEVPGHAPVITQLERGELRTSKGGFNVAERNVSNEQADIFAVIPLELARDGFTALPTIRMHDAAIGELYSGPTMRAISLAIASGGQLEQYTEGYDSLVIALTDSDIREVVPGNGPVDWKMNAGETRWIPRGTTHSETNVGSAPAAFILFEFN